MKPPLQLCGAHYSAGASFLRYFRGAKCRNSFKQRSRGKRSRRAVSVVARLVHRCSQEYHKKSPFRPRRLRRPRLMGKSPPLDPQAHLAAIIQSSDDAIVSKDLNGIIKSWNPAAERMFGYTSDEAVGSSIYLIIPEERKGEEAQVIASIKRGEIVDHYETVRQRKDGSLVDISLT